MQPYLVQHGAAKSEAEDPQRRLAAEGMETVERMAEYMSSLTGTRQVAGMAPNDDVVPIREQLCLKTFDALLLKVKGRDTD